MSATGAALNVVGTEYVLCRYGMYKSEQPTSPPAHQPTLGPMNGIVQALVATSVLRDYGISVLRPHPSELKVRHLNPLYETLN